jgi:hypothetical protein
MSQAKENCMAKPRDALGKRLKEKGKEKTTYEGELFYVGERKSSNVHVTQQFPGLVKLEGFKDRGASLSFDGKTSNGVSSPNSDEALIETFLFDYAEGMLDLVKNGAAVRLLGRGVGPDPKIEPNYTGPRYDIYEVTGSIRCRQDQLIRMKSYAFDTQTGLLLSTKYYDRSTKPPTKIETRFSVWGNIDGSAYPARIEHFENDQLKFTFIATEIKSEASSDKASFK